jgi:hypothetical protein
MDNNQQHTSPNHAQATLAREELAARTWRLGQDALDHRKQWLRRNRRETSAAPLN